MLWLMIPLKPNGTGTPAGLAATVPRDRLRPASVLKPAPMAGAEPPWIETGVAGRVRAEAVGTARPLSGDRVVLLVVGVLLAAAIIIAAFVLRASFEGAGR